MAENPNPTQPNLSPDQQAFENLINTSKEYSNILQSITQNTNSVFENFSRYGQMVSEDFTKAAQVFSANTEQVNNLGTALLTVKALTRNENIFGDLQKSTDQFATIQESTRAIGSNFSALTNIIPGIDGLIGKIGKNMLDNATAGQQVENEFVNMLASSGRLNEVFGEQGQLTGDLTAKTLKYAESLFTTADANGMTINQVAKYSSELGRIPGILTQNVDTGDKYLGNISALTASLKVLSGSGQDMNTMLGVMSKAYEDLGNAQGKVEDNAQKGLNLFSRMTTLAQDLNLRFTDTSQFLTTIANNFKYVGDNTDAASRVLERYIGALEKTGLTGQASLGIINDMIKGVQGLDVAQRAYLSAQTGGPGGLQGSIQIEQMLRQGNTDQVVQMVEQTLRRQFGGRIITQAEGATNQEAAAEFTRQRMMLMQGPFGALTGGSEEKATRLLEALAQGDRGLAEKQITPLQRVAEQGNSIQEKQNTVLTNIANLGERTAIATQLLAAGFAQTNFGIGNAAVGTQARMTAARLRDQEAAGVGPRRETAVMTNYAENLNDLRARLTSQLFEVGFDSGKGLLAGTKSAATDLSNVARGAGQSVSYLHGLLTTETGMRHQAANIPARGPTTYPEQIAPPRPTIPAPRLTTPVIATQQAITAAHQTSTKIENHLLIELAPGVEDKFKITSTTPAARIVNVPGRSRSTSNANADGTPHTTNEPGY